jgi:hypothetical protein
MTDEQQQPPQPEPRYVTHEDVKAILRELMREDAEMYFRCLMQTARYLAKTYDFRIKPWPEN